MGQAFENGGDPAEEAAAWLARLQSDRADASDWLAFEAWLAASPENWAAYDRAERIADEIDALAGPTLASLRARAAKRARTVRAAWALGGLAAAAGLLLWLAVPRAAPPQVFDTGRGQIREIALEDGTRITLNAQSHIEASVDRRARRVTMGEGEAAFTVAHDATRPFLITVGDRTVKVVGTEFDIDNRDRRLSVTVRQGVVEVAPSQGVQGDTVRLVRGGRLVHRLGAPVQKIDTVATPEDAFSWRERRLIYYNASLGEVAADLNRYFPRPLVLDPEAGRLTFSGVIVVADEDAVLHRLEELLPVAADPTAEGVVLRRR